MSPKPPVSPRLPRRMPVPQPIVGEEAGSSKTIEQQVRDMVDQGRLFALQQQIDMLEREINETGGLDQYPGKTVPWAHSFLYGPLPCLTARRTAGTGHEHLATLVDPTTPVLPRGDNLKVGRGGAWYWCATNVCPYLSWTFTSDPGGMGLVPVRAAAADIFDLVIDRNGGAQLLQNICGSGFAFDTGKPNVSFEIDLYDNKHNRSITNGKIPGEVFAGMAFGFIQNDEPARFEDDSEIVPRLYPTEIRMGTILSTDARFNAASVAAYVNLVFRGYRVLE